LAKLYANENFPLPVVEQLRELGHDVLTTMEAAKANQAIPDDEVLDFAATQNRAILTLNRKHFVRLHQSGISHAGIIACSFDPKFAAQAERIDAELRAISDLHQRLIRINRSG